MKIWTALSNALAGWPMIIRNEPGWRERFVLTAPGLTTALVIFTFATFLAVAIASMRVGMPSLFGVIVAMLALSLPLVALVLVFLGTRKAIKGDDPVLDLLVPATYALIVFLLAEGVLAMLAGPLVVLAWLGLAYLLYRLARAATTWNAAISAGFAVLTLVLLVAMRLALYMVSSAGIPN